MEIYKNMENISLKFFEILNKIDIKPNAKLVYHDPLT